jgi:hypothetical protein
VQLHELVDRVPGGLGDMRRPLLSASADNFSPTLQPIPPVDVDEPAPTAGADETMPLDASDTVGSNDMADEADSSATQPDITAMALSSDPDAHDNVWRMLDEEVANTQATQAAFPDMAPEPTAEVAAQPAPAPYIDPFHIDDEELQ